MRLENLIRLIQGKLLTSPAISAISGVTFSPSDVKSGDIYICLDRLQSSLEIAASSGAHALIFDKSVKVTDNEIAWIEVDNLDMALARLARFYIANHNIATYRFTNLEISLAKSMGLPKSIFLIEDNLTSLLRALFEGNLPQAIASNSNLLMDRIAPDATPLPPLESVPKILPSSTLFHTSFVFEERFYQHIALPSFWIDTFGRIAKLFTSFGWKFNNLKEINHFTPLFIDKHLCLHPFGTTRKALIIETDATLFEEEVGYLKSKYKQDDIFVCAPSSQSLHVKIDSTYKDIEELLSLDPKSFRYACILGDIAKIERLFQSQKSYQQPSLF